MTGFTEISIAEREDINGGGGLGDLVKAVAQSSVGSATVAFVTAIVSSVYKAVTTPAPVAPLKPATKGVDSVKNNIG